MAKLKIDGIDIEVPKGAMLLPGREFVEEDLVAAIRVAAGRYRTYFCGTGTTSAAAEPAASSCLPSFRLRDAQRKRIGRPVLDF